MRLQKNKGELNQHKDMLAFLVYPNKLAGLAATKKETVTCCIKELTKHEHCGDCSGRIKLNLN